MKPNPSGNRYYLGDNGLKTGFLWINSAWFGDTQIQRHGFLGALKDIISTLVSQTATGCYLQCQITSYQLGIPAVLFYGHVLINIGIFQSNPDSALDGGKTTNLIEVNRRKPRREVENHDAVQVKL